MIFVNLHRCTYCWGRVRHWSSRFHWYFSLCFSHCFPVFYFANQSNPNLIWTNLKNWLQECKFGTFWLVYDFGHAQNCLAFRYRVLWVVFSVPLRHTSNEAIVSITFPVWYCGGMWICSMVSWGCPGFFLVVISKLCQNCVNSKLICVNLYVKLFCHWLVLKKRWESTSFSPFLVCFLLFQFRPMSAVLAV